MKEITHSSHLGPEEKAFIFLYSALKHPLTEIKTDFEKFFESKIDGKIIINVQEKFKKEIAEKSKEELNDIGRVPIAHARIRMEFIYKGLQLASTPKVVSSQRISATEWMPVYDVDHTSIIKYLQLAFNEEITSKKLYYEILKNKDLLGESRPESGFKPVEVNTGLTEWNAS